MKCLMGDTGNKKIMTAIVLVLVVGAVVATACIVKRICCVKKSKMLCEDDCLE
ncbi:MAG: hypothetical protein IJZ03_03845 [Clostridia bacterium]|nr:hypothetical protein [Clostridia bacterium]